MQRRLLEAAIKICAWEPWPGLFLFFVFVVFFVLPALPNRAFAFSPGSTPRPRDTHCAPYKTAISEMTRGSWRCGSIQKSFRNGHSRPPKGPGVLVNEFLGSDPHRDGPSTTRGRNILSERLPRRRRKTEAQRALGNKKTRGRGWGRDALRTQLLFLASRSCSSMKSRRRRPGPAGTQKPRGAPAVLGNKKNKKKNKKEKSLRGRGDTQMQDGLLTVFKKK